MPPISFIPPMDKIEMKRKKEKPTKQQSRIQKTFSLKRQMLWKIPNSSFHMLLLHTLIGMALLQLASAGSCREAQLCCSGRDSSCVVQKAPINAIIEDLSDKPCYCDHACLKLGDCCSDFKNHCGVLDCQVSDWEQWSECDTNCGTGLMSRTRKVLQAAQNGGKHCPSLVQKRGCQGFRCHGQRDKKILREMALLLPAALSHNRHANDSSDIRRNLRLRYRDSHKHNREHEYCVEFEVIKASKACHKLPPYNLMQEGDRITVRCDLEALIPDATSFERLTTPSSRDTAKNAPAYHTKHKNLSNYQNNSKVELNSNSGIDDYDNNSVDSEDTEDDEENVLNVDSSSSEFDENQSSWIAKQVKTTAKPVAPAPVKRQAVSIHYHCRGEGLSGRNTRWGALPAPSCRGKWLRLTVGPPQICGHAQFIFV